MTDIQRTPDSDSAAARARRRLAPATFAQQLALIAQRCGAEVVLMPNCRAVLTGEPSAVGQLLTVIERTGRLVSSTTPLPNGVPGQVLVNVRLAPRVQTLVVRQAAPRRQLSRRALWFIAAAGVALIAGLVWAAYAAVTVLLANLPAVLVVAGIVVASLVLVGKSASGDKTFSGKFEGKIR